MNFVRLNVALKVPENVAKEAIRLSKGIASREVEMFVLDGINFHPHITVYAPEHPDIKVEEVLKAAEMISKTTPQASLRFMIGESRQGYIGIRFERSNEIQKLHENIVSKLNPLRQGHIRDKYQQDNTALNMEFSDDQKRNIEAYGHSDVMSLYNPHMTIIRIGDEDRALKIAKNFEWSIAGFTVEKLAVYSMGENGTCKKLIQEFNLG